MSASPGAPAAVQAHPAGPLWFWPLQERARDSAATRGPPRTASGWGTASARAACCASAARRATRSGDRPSAPARATARGAARSPSAEVTSVGPTPSPCPAPCGCPRTPAGPRPGAIDAPWPRLGKAAEGTQKPSCSPISRPPSDAVSHAVVGTRLTVVWPTHHALSHCRVREETVGQVPKVPKEIRI